MVDRPLRHRATSATPHARRIALAALLAGAAACHPAGRPGAPAPLAPAARLVPAPASLTSREGAPFTLAQGTAIVVDDTPELTRIGEMLASVVRPSTGFPLPVRAAPGGAPAGAIALRLAGDSATLGDEGYELTVTADSVRLVAARPAGLFRGTQTIRQLLPAAVESEVGETPPGGWTIPPLRIVDRPRFSWRGTMLDPARHFLSVKEVKQFIDLAALYKLNTVHLHLTDDQGWRIEIKSRPELTTVGSQSPQGAGGFYTQADYAELVRYAQERYITLIPEVEMPGHAGAAVAALPPLRCSGPAAAAAAPAADTSEIDTLAVVTPAEGFGSNLCVESDSTFAVLDDVVREIAGLTPGPYFHIGGDEVVGLAPEAYNRFIERVQELVSRHGKRTIGWEEITKARLVPTTVVQQWKSDSATAGLRYGVKFVMSPAQKAYLDMKYTPATELGLTWAAFIELRTAYDWNPTAYLPGVGEREVLGVEAPLWGETIDNIGAAEYLALPRLPALAEVAWSPQAARDWSSFRTRVAAQAQRWRYLGFNYYRSPQVDW